MPLQDYLTDPKSPWYRPPPGVTKGTPRMFGSINAGLIISNDEGRRWFKEKYGRDLLDDHRADLNVPLRLAGILRENGIAQGCIFAPRRSDPFISDFLVITQHFVGRWMNDGPDNYDEVLDEDVKPKETVVEERVKEWLLEELGQSLSSHQVEFGLKSCL